MPTCAGHKRGREPDMRSGSLIIVTALVLAACGGGSDTVADTAAGSAAETATGGVSDSATGVEVDSPTNDAVRPSGGSSDYCQAIQRVFEEAPAIDEENSDFGDLYTYLLELFRQLADEAPNELESDFALVEDGLERYVVWVEDPFSRIPSMKPSRLRSNKPTNESTPIRPKNAVSTWVSKDDDAEIVYAGDPSVGEDSTASQIITLGGETYDESLNGPSEVSCDLYGDSETGSVSIYLDGPEFQSSISSYDTGVQLGTHEGLIWVFAWDLTLDELTWDLQEIDGTFVLSRAEEVSEGEWLLEGSFAAAVEEPPASITATFSCTGTAY